MEKPTDFLKAEYEQCLSLIKYYDDRHLSIVKYGVSLSSGIPAFLVAVFRFGPEDVKANIWMLTGLVSSMTFLGLLILYVILVQNRLYFVYPVRQVNAIRKFCLDKMGDTDFENQMYLDTGFSALKWSSTQTLLILFVAVQLGVFLGLSVYSFNYDPATQISNIWGAAGIATVFSIITFVLAAIYLREQSRKPADESVHYAGGEVEKNE